MCVSVHISTHARMQVREDVQGSVHPRTEQARRVYAECVEMIRLQKKKVGLGFRL